MKLTITTGVRIANDYPDRGFATTVFTVDVPDSEIDPEDVFRAGNRIGDDIAYDLRTLRTDWQRKVREELDTNESPSISVGDTIEVCTDQGVYLGGWKCEPCGFSIMAAAR